MYKIFICAFLMMSTTAFATPRPVAKPDINAPQKTFKAQSSLPEISPPKHAYDRPLNQREADLYREVFALQSKGDIAKATSITAKIDNHVLMGHVLAHRYFQPKNSTSTANYKSWMRRYSDHPQSKRIEKIINTKSSRYKNNVVGTLADLRYFANGSKYISDHYNAQQRYQIRQAKNQIAKDLDKGSVSFALSYFNSHAVQKFIDPIDKAQILAGIAAHYLYLKRPEKARSAALKALKSSEKAPLAGWVAGLTAWMDDDMGAAARYFTIASNAPYASPWMTSAASYWGARASTRAGLYKDVSPLLAKAVQNQRTFYGLIATKAMGYGYDFNWTMPKYSSKDKDILLQYPSGARAVALVEIGQLSLAEAELFNLPVKQNQTLATAAIAMATHYNLAGYAMRFSSIIENPAGGFYDAGLFPISSWTHNVNGSDKALLNSFIRQESRFIAAARNGTGATGLMQIMPNTAAFVTGNGDFKSPKGQMLLSNPKTNVRVGADYLNHLLELQAVNGDLFGLAIAYNAGPGKLRRWKKDLPSDDPLLFIELIPASETRAFVERVVTNYWAYQMQMGIEPKTLTSVASGDWPKLKF
jgi:soluble lytic murein transglycosylase